MTSPEVLVAVLVVLLAYTLHLLAQDRRRRSGVHKDLVS